MSITPNSPIQFTSKYYNNDPLAFYGLGMPLLSGGLVNVVQVNGVGLLTNGFVWQLPEIWFDPQSVLGLSTGWNVAAGYSGCVAASLVVTTWTASHAFGAEFNF